MRFFWEDHCWICLELAMLWEFLLKYVGYCWDSLVILSKFRFCVITLIWFLDNWPWILFCLLLKMFEMRIIAKTVSTLVFLLIFFNRLIFSDWLNLYEIFVEILKECVEIFSKRICKDLLNDFASCPGFLASMKITEETVSAGIHLTNCHR